MDIMVDKNVFVLCLQEVLDVLEFGDEIVWW